MCTIILHCIITSQVYIQRKFGYFMVQLRKLKTQRILSGCSIRYDFSLHPTEKHNHRQKFLSIQRKADLMITRACRTVSTEVLFISGRTLPIDLLPTDQSNVIRRTGRKDSVKEQILEELHKLWEEQDGLAEQPVDYHLMQILSGHGCFNEYLYRFTIREINLCLYCGGLGSSKQAFFICHKWNMLWYASLNQELAVYQRDDQSENLHCQYLTPAL